MWIRAETAISPVGPRALSEEETARAQRSSSLYSSATAARSGSVGDNSL